MKFALVLLIAFALIASALCCTDDSWSEFKLRYDKKYKSEEEDLHRRQIFCDNVKSVAKHNVRFHRGEVSYDRSINLFGDLTAEEFMASFGGIVKAQTV